MPNTHDKCTVLAVLKNHNAKSVTEKANEGMWMCPVCKDCAAEIKWDLKGHSGWWWCERSVQAKTECVAMAGEELGETPTKDGSPNLLYC